MTADPALLLQEKTSHMDALDTQQLNGFTIPDCRILGPLQNIINASRNKAPWQICQICRSALEHPVLRSAGGTKLQQTWCSMNKQSVEQMQL